MKKQISFIAILTGFIFTMIIPSIVSFAVTFFVAQSGEMVGWVDLLLNLVQYLFYIIGVFLTMWLSQDRKAFNGFMLVVLDMVVAFVLYQAVVVSSIQNAVPVMDLIFTFGTLVRLCSVPLIYLLVIRR
jgi:hypothetical protein